MSTLNAVPFRSTIFYTAAGVPASAGSVLMVGANGTQNFTTSLGQMTFSTLIGSTITTPTIIGTTTLGQNVSFPNRYIELGTDSANAMYIDFHSSDAAVPDFSTRIQSIGGATTGTGALNMTASTIGLTANVGIGTTTPSDTLVLNSGNAVLNNSAVASSGYMFNQNSIWGGLEVEGLTNTGAQTINIGVNSNRTKPWASTYNGLWLRVDNRTGSNYNGFHFFNKTATSGTETEIMTVLSSGNVGIGAVAPACPLHVYNSNSVFTGGPTVQIGDGQADSGGTYGMLQLVRANNGADNKAHLAFIKNGLTLFGMGYYPGTSITTFGLVPSFGTMATTNGLWIATNGSVGIGSTTPTQTLDVAGTIARSGMKLPRVDYGTITTANPMTIPILFSDTQYNMVEIRVRYVVNNTSNVNINISATSTQPATLNFNECGVTTVQYNTPTAPDQSYVAGNTTSLLFAKSAEAFGIEHNLLFRMTRTLGTGGYLRNHYSYDNVYCWSAVGTAQGTGRGHIDITSMTYPIASISFTPAAGTLSCTYSTTHYN